MSELTGQTIPITMRISFLIKLFSQISQMLNKFNSLSSWHCRDLKLVSSLPRVRYSESLFQAKRLKFIFACDFAAIYIIGLCVIAGCLQGKKEMIFQQKTLCKSSVSLSNWPVQPRSSQLVLTFGKCPECGVKLAQGFSLVRKWTFALVIITQLLLYSHFFY